MSGVTAKGNANQSCRNYVLYRDCLPSKPKR
jgi:hypothetical protein